MPARHTGAERFREGKGIVAGIADFNLPEPLGKVKNRIIATASRRSGAFKKRHLAKFNGVKQKFELHLKEREWRYNRALLQFIAGLNRLAAKNKKLMGYAISNKSCTSGSGLNTPPSMPTWRCACVPAW